MLHKRFSGLAVKASRVRPWASLGKRHFRIEKGFVGNFNNLKAPFGFNGLGELVYYRTYSRLKPDGNRETWQETVERVVNGTFSMQQSWMEENMLGWDEEDAQEKAKIMYERIFSMKFLPPGRGLWCMGTSVTEERGLFAALNNCAFISTENANEDFAEAFCFTMDASMLGVGVGFDTKGAGKVEIKSPRQGEQTYVVPDTREGWVDSLRKLLESYCAKVGDSPAITFDYSKVRPAGQPIKGFGGTSSGPEPLKLLHTNIRRTLEQHGGKSLSITAIVDIMNFIGQCVVAGNVRRTAEIAFGDPNSLEYIELKNYDVNPQRRDYGWTSNNSVFAKLGMDYKEVVSRIRKNGEPGVAWLENMRNYGQMNGKVDRRDWRAAGGNPCLEQTLESHELCCLVETFPDHHDNLEDYLKTLESAFLYAKTVTLGKTHWSKSNRVMLRNRRVGCSMSGLAQFIAHKGLHELKEWAEAGYKHLQVCDKELSELFIIPRSIKTTCVKPSGTVSLLAGATPGLHFPEARFYIRRVRIGANAEVVDPLRKAGYDLEPAVTDPENTLVVSIPIDVGEGLRTAKEVGMWEQLSIAAFMQRHWADNQVSCTVTFNDKAEGNSIVNALDVFQYQLKGVSFLPRMEMGAYEQMPYEEITEEQFREMSSKLKPLDLSCLASSQVFASNEEEALSQGNGEPSFGIGDGVALNHDLPDAFCDACENFDEENRKNATTSVSR